MCVCVCVDVCVSVYVRGQEGKEVVVVGGRGRLREAALWSTSSAIYHSSQAEEEGSSCSVSQTISSLRTPAAILVSSGGIRQ